MKRILVVGAGLSGSAVARSLADAGEVVDVIDRRAHVAGNAYDFVGEQGIRLHAYGPHLFHTSNREVVDFLSRFTDWLPYRHRVKAMLEDGRLVTLPVNAETARIVGPENIESTFYRPYTRKMWGVDPELLDQTVLARVRVRDDLNEDYFPDDAFQALPADGYTRMVERMLEHPGIRVRLSTPYASEMDARYDHVFNSMSIDEYFGFDLGMLPYRSIRFETHVLPVPRIFPVATVNFTHAEPYTRVTEWKNLPGHGDHPSHTVLTFETPCDFTENGFERHYPVKDRDRRNRELYRRYEARVPGQMTFIGRCGLYAYLDMHQAVSSALASARGFLGKRAA